jgi:hypothetical protein
MMALRREASLGCVAVIALFLQFGSSAQDQPAATDLQPRERAFSLFDYGKIISAGFSLSYLYYKEYFDLNGEKQSFTEQYGRIDDGAGKRHDSSAAFLRTDEHKSFGRVQSYRGVSKEKRLLDSQSVTSTVFA